jgi:hypothetical protein
VPETIWRKGTKEFPIRFQGHSARTLAEADLFNGNGWTFQVIFSRLLSLPSLLTALATGSWKELAESTFGAIVEHAATAAAVMKSLREKS